MATALGKGEPTLDIGVNLGVVDLAMDQIAGPAGRVKPFESQPNVAQLLRTSLPASNFSQATIHECALSE